MNKRGISPVGLTVSLIIFAIVFGLLMLKVSETESLSYNVCPLAVGMKVTEIAGSEEVCYDPEKQVLRFTIENGVETDISGFQIEIDEEEIPLTGLSIGKAATYVGNIPSTGNIKKKILIPIVEYDGQKRPCQSAAISRKNIRIC